MSSSKTQAKPAPAVKASTGKTERSAPRGSISSAKPASRSATKAAFDGLLLFRDDPQTRIAAIRQGIPAAMVGQLSTTMGMSKELLLGSLGLSRATISRKERDASALSKDESERVLGVASLIGKVQTMVEESGDSNGFDAARWVANWLVKPLPALGGATPASYMDTFEGQKLVSDILSMSQSGAYA